MLDISSGSAYAVPHGDLGYGKVCVKWIPRQLTDPQKQHTEVATQFLQCHDEVSGLLDRIVTGGEP
jgi:hypothetical protein